jgi:hypothetical protein
LSRGARFVVGIVGFVIALNVVLALLHSVTGGTPGGPASSSYSTGPAGVAAYASLLARDGHVVRRVRAVPARAALDPSTTVVLLAPDGPVAAADRSALRRFVKAGGRLLVGGPTGSWLGRIIRDPPQWSPTPASSLEPLAPLPELTGIRNVEATGRGSWEAGSALPVLGDGDRALLSVDDVGGGRVLLLANVAPLQNHLLDHGDDAALGLALAGPPGRPIAFLEAYHGYGAATAGFGAIPVRWWFSFGVLALAVAALMLASGRRLGPPQPNERELPPPRREYVESLGGVLARSRPHDAAVKPVQIRARRLLAARFGLGLSPTDEQIRVAAIRLGLPQSDAAALTQPATTDADVLAIGRAHALIARESRP